MVIVEVQGSMWDGNKSSPRIRFNRLDLPADDSPVSIETRKFSEILFFIKQWRLDLKGTVSNGLQF